MHTHKATFIFYSRGLDYKAKPMLKAMLINKDFLTWPLIGWQCADSQSDARFENICFRYQEFPRQCSVKCHTTVDQTQSVKPDLDVSNTYRL